jgi:hypothetical protein
VPTLPPAPEHWPKRTDTREFQVVRVDEPEAESGPAAPESLFTQPPLPDVGELYGEEPREFAWGD